MGGVIHLSACMGVQPLQFQQMARCAAFTFLVLGDHRGYLGLVDDARNALLKDCFCVCLPPPSPPAASSNAGICSCALPWFRLLLAAPVLYRTLLSVGQPAMNDPI